MKMYSLFVALVFPFFFSCKNAVKDATASPLADSLQTQKAAPTSTASIVFTSADGGQSWQDISNGLPESVNNDYLTGNVFFADESGLYLANRNTIYHTAPNAGTPFWTKALLPNNLSGLSGTPISIAPGRQGIFAYNSREGIFQRTTGTNAWSPLFTDLKDKHVRNVLQTAEGNLLVSTDKGLYTSTDAGKRWNLLSPGGMGGKIAESNGVLLTTGMGIMRSTDGGIHWNWVIQEGGVGIDVQRIPGGFAAINYSESAKTRRIRTSYDGGQSWQPIDAGFPGPAFMDAALPTITYNNPAHNSNDSARHSKEATPSMPEYKTSIIQVGDNFFCGHTDGVYKTTNKGKTWKLVLPAAKGKMFVLAAYGNRIYAIQTENHC